MMTIISGVGLLLLTLAVFSIFSLKFPKGQPGDVRYGKRSSCFLPD